MRLMDATAVGKFQVLLAAILTVSSLFSLNILILNAN